MAVVLMVAEKPSLAQSLAKILSNNSCDTWKGSNGACSVHEWRGKFQGAPATLKMTSVCGHVMTRDFVPKYQSWDKTDPVELFTAGTIKKEANEKLRMPAHLEKEARGASYLVLWLDCDKEGENICFEVIDCVKNVMKVKPHGQTVFRAKFSAITDKDIKAAMQNLGQPNLNESLSVDARQELDLRVGCAFTRFQTKFFQGKYGDLDSSVVSYGPCQTPTLGFCVARHDEIHSFKPETYWVISLRVTHQETKMAIDMDWERVRLFDKEIAQMFLNQVTGHSQVRIASVSRKEKSKQKPHALNTVEMLKTASSGLGLGPQYTMQIAERLYVQGYISYPRTETTSYPTNFDLSGTLKMFANNPDFRDCRALIESGVQTPRKGEDVGDHPPITPARSATMNELGSEAFKLYDFIVRYFIGTVSPDCKFMQTTIKFEIGGEKFSRSGKALTSPGFTQAMTWQALKSDEVLPPVREGDICTVDWVKLDEKRTSPPDYLTESELITLMEKHSIGTDASIPVHINNICERNYVQVVGASRRLEPNPLGIVLVHGYQKIDPELVLPTMRSATEKLFNLIAQGKQEYKAVVDHSVKTFEMKYIYFVQHISGMDELFECSFSALSASGKPLSRCGKCKRYLKLVEVRPVRLHCNECDMTYKVPQGGSVQILPGDTTCPLDNFELCLWTQGHGGKSFAFCPYCYNHPPFPGMKNGSSCNECLHPTCSQSFSKNVIAPCQECGNGLLAIDPLSAPSWKIICNSCDIVWLLRRGILKVTKSKYNCEECCYSRLRIVFPEGHSPLPNGALKEIGCMFCDKKVKQLVTLSRPNVNNATAGGHGGRGSRGGRGGRGGRGRGEGRGGSRGEGRGRGRGGGRGRY